MSGTVVEPIYERAINTDYVVRMIQKQTMLTQRNEAQEKYHYK